MADENWKSSFRKRHRTLFTKAHKLQSQAPDNIRVHIVVQRVDEDDATTFSWNSHPHDPEWPPNHDQMRQSTCKTMTPEDMRRDAQRRSRTRKKKARPQSAPQVGDDTASESSEWEIRNLFEAADPETGMASSAVGIDDVDVFDSSDAMLGSEWHVSRDGADAWHAPTLYDASQQIVTSVGASSMISGPVTPKREASSPVDSVQQKTPRRDEMVYRTHSSPRRPQRQSVLGGLQPLVFPTSPM